VYEKGPEEEGAKVAWTVAEAVDVGLVAVKVTVLPEMEQVPASSLRQERETGTEVLREKECGTPA